MKPQVGGHFPPGRAIHVRHPDSVLHVDRAGETGGVAARGKSAQCLGDRVVPTIDSVHILLSGDRRRVAGALLQVGQVRARRCGEAEPGVAQIVERQVDTDLVPSSNECLVDRVAPHPLAIPTDEEELRTRPLLRVRLQQMADMRRDGHWPLAGIRLGVFLELLGRLQQLDSIDGQGLPLECPASPARVKGALRASQAIEQTALDLLTRTALTLVWQQSGGRGRCGLRPGGNVRS